VHAQVVQQSDLHGVSVTRDTATSKQ
jgi:hypothetical protein